MVTTLPDHFMFVLVQISKKWPEKNFADGHGRSEKVRDLFKKIVEKQLS